MLPSLQDHPAPTSSDAFSCAACHSGRLKVFFEIEQVPILCNILCRTRQEALSVPRGDICLGFCEACGHVYNAAFDANVMHYGAAYENSLQFSPRFREYLESVAHQLIERHDIRNKDIIEIGCGQGDFLSLLCRLGGNRGVGFDPSFDPDKIETALPANVQIEPRHYAHQHADRPVALLCCRHVLEHIPQPLEFLQEIRRTLGNRQDVLVFFEVPNALFTLDRLAIWDLIYEHCSYFTPASLRRIFELGGFEVLSVENVYDEQFLTITARPTRNAHPRHASTLDGLAHSIRRFETEYRAKAALWRQRRDDLQTHNRRAVVWGAGSKGATFLNVLGISHDVMPYAIDLNPRKHDHFIVGAAQRIMPPQFLREHRPDTVIAMNAIYSEEIRTRLLDLDVSAEVLLA